MAKYRQGRRTGNQTGRAASSNNRRVNRPAHSSACRDSVIGIANHYELDGSGFKSRKGRKTFSSLHPPRPALGSSQPSVKLEKGLIPVYKAAGRDVDQPPLFSAEVKKEQSCTSTPYTYLYGMSRGDLCPLRFSAEVYTNHHLLTGYPPPRNSIVQVAGVLEVNNC